MRRLYLAAALVALWWSGAGCQDSGSEPPDGAKGERATLDARETRLAAALASVDSTKSANEPLARWLLPAALAEISGLALTPDGRLFAHNDESARIIELDYRRGTVVKQFFVGQQGLGGDFEGLAYAEDRFFLLSSSGTLYEFREGVENERVDYTTHDTRLGKECEFEGVAYDPKANALVLACKHVEDAQFADMLVLYRYELGDSGDGEPVALAVPYADAIGKNGWKQLRPTDITVDPSSGNYVLVAALEQALVSVTPAGAVVFSRPLGGRHPQAEGIAITRDHILIISDESTNAAASITLYRWP